MTAFSPKALAVLVSLLLVSVTGIVPEPAEAQILNRIRNRVTSDVERRIEERAVAAARRTLALAEDAIVCALTDEACIEQAKKDGKEPVVVDSDGKPISGYEPQAGGSAAGQQPAGAQPG